MATKTENWADDDSGSSDDESVEEQVQQQPQQQAPTSSQHQQEHHHQRREGNHGHGGHGQGHGHGHGHGQEGQKFHDKRDRDHPREFVKSDPYHPPKSDYIIFIKNLLFSANDDQLGQFFADGGCDVTDAHVYIDDGRPRGAGVVILADEASYRSALEADGADFHGRKISVQPKHQGYNQQGRGDARSRDGYKDREGGGGRGGYSREGPPRDNRVRDDRRGRGGRGNDFERPHVASAEKSDETPVRPKLVLASRTTPLEKVGEFVGSNSGIFGSGKARDELSLEEKKVAAEAPAPAAVAPAPVVEALPTPPPAPQPSREFSDKKPEGGRGDWGRGRGRGDGGRGGRGERPYVARGGEKPYTAARGGDHQPHAGRGDKTFVPRGGGEKPYGARGGRGEGGRGRGDRKKDHHSEAPVAAAPAPAQATEATVAPPSEKSDEQLAIEKFQSAQEKRKKLEQQKRAEDSKKGQNQVVNKFNLLQLDDDSDDDEDR